MAKEKDLFVSHIQGIPQIPQWGNCRISRDSEFLKIEHMNGGIMMNKNVVNTFKIPIDKLISLDVVTEKEIREKSKSVVGRGVAGGLVFGPAGMLLGGLSGVGTKQKTVIKFIFNIAYHSEDGVKTIMFNPGQDPSRAFKFAREAISSIYPPGQEFIL